ncbi:MAG TPA: hypothetical protein VIH45_06595 [Desulfuromonadaceae bacterium]
MKTLATMIGTVVTSAPVAAFAASAGRTDDSGIFVWIFLGFCALIVLLQTLPAILLMTGIVKGMVGMVSDKAKAVVKKS